MMPPATVPALVLCKEDWTRDSIVKLAQMWVSLQSLRLNLQHSMQNQVPFPYTLSREQ
jgi:hypothetical protein